MPSSEWPTPEAIEATAIALAEHVTSLPWVCHSRGSQDHFRRRTSAALTAAAKASPVIPAPRCETCNGNGLVPRGDEKPPGIKCSKCRGTGMAEVIPVAVLRELRAWITKSQALPALRSQDFEAGRQLAFKAVVGWLDEHTREEPNG